MKKQTLDPKTVLAGLHRQLKALGTPERAEGSKRYLKSSMRHFGVTVPELRSIAKAFVREHPELDRDALWKLVNAAWTGAYHEDRLVAIGMLVYANALLTAADITK